MSALHRIWIYEATIMRPVDGDTVVCDIDQGMNHWSRNQYIRLAGINAPELKGDTREAGQRATAFLMGLIPTGSQVWLATIAYHEFEKYGRVLAVIYNEQPPDIPWSNADLSSLMLGSVNQAMLDSENAVPYDPSGL